MPLIRSRATWREFMKINSNYEVRNIGGIDIIVPVGGDMSLSGVITLNDSALFIWNALKDDITIDELVDKVCAEYDAPKDVIKADVEEIIEKFKEHDLVV